MCTLLGSSANSSQEFVLQTKTSANATHYRTDNQERRASHSSRWTGHLTPANSHNGQQPLQPYQQKCTPCIEPSLPAGAWVQRIIPGPPRPPRSTGARNAGAPTKAQRLPRRCCPGQNPFPLGRCTKPSSNGEGLLLLLLSLPAIPRGLAQRPAFDLTSDQAATPPTRHPSSVPCPGCPHTFRRIAHCAASICCLQKGNRWSQRVSPHLGSRNYGSTG